MRRWIAAGAAAIALGVAAGCGGGDDSGATTAATHGATTHDAPEIPLDASFDSDGSACIQDVRRGKIAARVVLENAHDQRVSGVGYLVIAMTSKGESGNVRSDIPYDIEPGMETQNTASVSPVDPGDWVVACRISLGGDSHAISVRRSMSKSAAERFWARQEASRVKADAQRIVRDRVSFRWDEKSPDERRAIAAAWLHGPGKGFAARVTPQALVRETSRNIDELMGDASGHAGKIFRFPASLAESSALGAARGKHLGSGLVGKTSAQVEELIGEPNRDQNIGGVVYWYYQAGESMYQVVLSGGVVSQVNKY